jgi:hypothetical protein
MEFFSIFLFLIKNCNYLTLNSTKDVKATGEAFSPQKRTSSTLKDEIYYLFSIFLGDFCI